MSKSIFDPMSLRFSKIIATWLATLQPQIGKFYSNSRLNSKMGVAYNKKLKSKEIRLN